MSSSSLLEVVARAGPGLEYAYLFKQIDRLRSDTPPCRVNVTVQGDRRDFHLGEKLVFEIASEDDCYVLLFNLDSAASLHLVLPNQYSQENLVRAGTRIEFPSSAMRKGLFELEFLPPAGEETFKLITSNQPIGWRTLTTAPNGREFDVALGRPLDPSSPARDLTHALAAMLSEKARDPNFHWSEETIVLRSHPR